MDTTGFSQIGRYGTISLLKQSPQGERNTVVTAFGIDSEELTFGRDASCSVRLYYPDVSPVHCRIVFEERKAFLIVLGNAGLIVDGCHVFPQQLSNKAHITIPLSNNSEIEIHGKRFRFTYPPKELRAALLETPARPSNRALRLSMIRSAEVFSPRPSPDPRENLRILQCPIKPSFSSPGSPQTPGPSDSGEADESIVLVQGNHPRVVEEDADLVILEDVPSPSSVWASQQREFVAQTPPRNRSQSRNTLHRAVLIRSAQRAVLRAEKEREEEEEELEVLDVVASGELMGAGSGEYPGEKDEEAAKPETKSMLRRSLERLWPSWRGSSEDGEVVEDINEDSDSNLLEHMTDEHIPENDENVQDKSEEMDQPAPLPRFLNQTPVRRPLGSFMTPQALVQRPLFPQATATTNRTEGRGRYSVGGVLAQRVVVEQAWRVKDIVIPSISAAAGIKSEAHIGKPIPSPRRPPPSDAERRAVQERRRSALREPDTFFAGGVPGMSPTKDNTRALRSVSPVKYGTSWSRSSLSPVKTRDSSVQAGEWPTAEEEEEEDTRTLLERMKETVEEMKRRRSVLPVLPVSSRGVFDDVTPTEGQDNASVEHVTGDQAEAQEEFSLLRSGASDLTQTHSGAYLTQKGDVADTCEPTPTGLVATPAEQDENAFWGGGDNTTNGKDEPSMQGPTREAAAVALQDDAQFPQASSSTTRNTRQSTAEPPDPPARRTRQTDNSTIPAPAVTRRSTRKTPELKTADTGVNPAPKRGRRAVAKAAAGEEVQVSEERGKAAVKPRKTRMTTTAVPVVNVEDDEDPDPIDSVNGPEGSASAPTPIAPQKTRRRVVKLEPMEEDVLVQTRSRKVTRASSAEPKVAAAMAVKPSATTKAAGTNKQAAAGSRARATRAGKGEMNKENTPGLGTPESSGEGDETGNVGSVVQPRGAGRLRGSKVQSKVKVEEEEEIGVRITRTRTRTKTG